ncbi:hypothetical protein GQ602_002118 [Ophiocordyceps camponoti-floridani]|uniref:Uncharacterized protein n=1 Tax=Ophiocordyceps camponoti-floridani TaxID=2030778 RepID=A0A8H4Q9Q8_9HYPO|nr:hypothetical protein GQ602_002118 [Ophiocordyceps camponoti-floridani]
MAPPSLTYGKKGLLRPWGSRRRERQGQAQEPLAPTTAGPSDDRETHDEHGHSDPIERLASALLDDSDREIQIGRPSTAAGVQSPPLSSGDAFGRGQIPRSKTGLPSPFTMHPVFSSPEAAAAAQAAAAPYEGRAFAPQQHAHGYGAGAFRSARGSLDIQMSSLQPGAREVDDKVRAMLAATEALKSKAPQEKAASTPKTSTSVPSRVLNKVSNVWDRFHSGPLAQVSKARAKLQKRPSQNEASSPVPQKVPPQNPFKRPPNTIPSAAPIHVDDDVDAIRQIPGPSAGPVPRRTVMPRPSALVMQSDQMADMFSDERLLLPQTANPFANPPSPSERRPSPADERAGENGSINSADDESARSQAVIENPFEAEVGFYSNLEDRILSTPPVAASTPKVRSRSNSMTNSTDESALERGYSEVQIDLARVAVRVGDDGKGPGRARQVTLQPSSSRSNVAQAEAPQQTGQRVGEIRGGDKVKKHPSPSKKDLEDLEKAFQRKEAAVLKKPVLRSRDANRLISVASSRLHEADPLGLQSPCRSQRLDGSVRVRREVRFATISRRVAGRYDDYDELC